MEKIAFCFPGQGALEAGMGRELAEAFPAAMDVYRVGSEASGLDLQKLCFDSPIEDLVETEVRQPALVATCLAILAAIREAGLEPDVVVGHSVGEFSALASVGAIGTPEAIALVRQRGLAVGGAWGGGAGPAGADRRGARAGPGVGGGGGGAPGLAGGDPGSRGRGGRDAL